MKRILQIPNYYYPHIGGIEQVAHDIADSLAGENSEQKIICFNEDAEGGGYNCHTKETVSETVHGVEIIRCGCVAKIASQSLSLTYAKELKKVINEFKPDTIILHYPNPFVSSFFMPMLSENIRLILWWHLDITKQKLLGKLFHGQTIKLLKRADKVIATSPNYIAGSPYLSMFKDKCIVIPNCIRPERLKLTEYSELKSEEIRNKYYGKTICLAIGRHVPYKGMGYLIKAAELLDDSFAVLIGGKGPLTDSLKEEAAGNTKVEFLGRVADEDMAAYYNACDIFCFPSITKNEAFGIALAEGMYFGKPAVTFNIPGSGVNFVNLDKVTGIECPNGDYAAFAYAIKNLANDKDLRTIYGENARKRVIECFLEETFRENVVKI